MKFSIITVCFNSKSTIGKTIESVVNQNKSEYEYIIVDGKSSDGTLDIIKDVKKKYHNIRVISEPDAGIYDAMNKGIEIASGDIIGIINSDDWYEKNALLNIEKIFLSNQNVEIVTGQMNLCYRDGKYKKTLPLVDVDRNIFKCMPIYHPTMFVKKEVYKRIGKYNINYKYAADYDFVIRAYLSGINMIQMPIVISNMRLGGATGGNGGFFSAISASYRCLLEEKIIKESNANGKYRFWFILQLVRRLMITFVKSMSELLGIYRW